LPGDKLIRPGAHAAACRRTVGFASFFDRGRAGNGKRIHGKVRQEGRHWAAHDKLHIVIVNFLDFGDDARIIKTAPHGFVIFEDLAGIVIGMGREAPAFEVENYCVSVEICSVMELNAFQQLAAPHGRVFIGGAFCQRGNRIGGALIKLVQGIQDLSGHTERFAVGHNAGIQLDGISTTAKDERILGGSSRLFSGGSSRFFSGGSHWGFGGGGRRGFSTCLRASRKQHAKDNQEPEYRKDCLAFHFLSPLRK